MLARLPMLDPVPVRWLHLTTQGIGFTDEVDRADVEAIVKAAQTRCARLTSFKATVGPPSVDSEAVKMDARPVKRLVDLRSNIRDAIADIWGRDRVPEPAEGWRPHVSLSYSNAAGPAQPIADALAAHPPQSTEFTISAVSLIKLNRDRRMYEWDDVAAVRLGRVVEGVD
jgi:2'-5' RNA ligase